MTEKPDFTAGKIPCMQVEIMPTKSDIYKLE